MTRYSIELRYRIFVKGYRINSKVIQVTAGATGDLIGNKVTEKIQRSQKLHCRILQRQLQVKQKKNQQGVLKKDIYLQKRAENY